MGDTNTGRIRSARSGLTTKEERRHAQPLEKVRVAVQKDIVCMQATACCATAQYLSRPPESVPAYTRHLYARLAVIRALRCTAVQIPDDAEMTRRERDYDAARSALIEAEYATPGESNAFEALKQARAHAALCKRLANGEPPSAHGSQGAPRRFGGAPWVWRGNLLLALPLWPERMVSEAVARLVSEGLAESSWRDPPRTARAVRLTARADDPSSLTFASDADPFTASLVRLAFSPSEKGVS